MGYTIFILDDHPAVTQGLKRELQELHETIYTATRYSELKAFLETDRPDLLILDYELGAETAPEIIPEIRKRCGELPILVYTMHAKPWIISLLVKIEVNGIVVKDDPLSELISGVKRILYEKERYFSSAALKSMLAIMGDRSAQRSLIYTPSPRELEVINLISEGMTSEEIASHLFLTKNTIDTIRKNILLKSGATNVSHLMRLAFFKGWINL